MRWDPAQYARYADERSRPFFDLIGRIGAEAPRRVVDLGCGSGELTLTLADRWPGAEVSGLDASDEMIARAPAGCRVRFSVADAATFDASGTDVLVSNAMLQWLPHHLDHLARWAEALAPGGWLAFQVPANFDQPSHVLMRELASAAPWQEQLGEVLRHDDAVAAPRRYLELFAARAYAAEVWQTEYLHVLPGEDPVLEWVRGTGLRPILGALSPAAAARFETEYRDALRRAYPRGPHGTVFPFRRTFVVAHRVG